MDRLASLRPTPQHPVDDCSAQSSTNEPPCSSAARYSKSALGPADYMAKLNERLRRHPRYQPGMNFPDPQPGSTPMLAAALAWEGPWDCTDVFASVLEDVARDYDQGS